MLNVSGLVRSFYIISGEIGCLRDPGVCDAAMITLNECQLGMAG